MYNICIHLQTCLDRIFDCLFPKKNNELLAETSQYSDDMEHYIIYKNNPQSRL